MTKGNSIKLTWGELYSWLCYANGALNDDCLEDPRLEEILTYCKAKSVEYSGPINIVEVKDTKDAFWSYLTLAQEAAKELGLDQEQWREACKMDLIPVEPEEL